MNTRLLPFVGILGMLAAGRATPQGSPPAPILTEQHSGTSARLQAVSAVNGRVVWVSGVRATWARTLDGGATWAADSMKGPDSWMEFRDVHAVSADRAWLLAAGPGDSSRIYRTEDGGRHWTLQFENRDSLAFYDALDFWDARRGIVVGDAVRGHMMVMTTNDGGASWKPVPTEGVPPALPGEGAPAASGTCLVTRPGGRAWFSTEADSGARVYASLDYGRTWRVAGTPIVRGKASGIASVAMRDDVHGFALGGRLLEPRDTSVAVAATADGGRTWAAVARPPFTARCTARRSCAGGRMCCSSRGPAAWRSRDCAAVRRPGHCCHPTTTGRSTRAAMWRGRWVPGAGSSGSRRVFSSTPTSWRAEDLPWSASSTTRYAARETLILASSPSAFEKAKHPIYGYFLEASRRQQP